MAMQSFNRYSSEMQTLQSLSLSSKGVVVAIKSNMSNKTNKKLESEQQKLKNFFKSKTKDTVE